MFFMLFAQLNFAGKNTAHRQITNWLINIICYGEYDYHFAVTALNFVPAALAQKPLCLNGLGNLYVSFYYCKPSRFSIALHKFA